MGTNDGARPRAGGRSLALTGLVAAALTASVGCGPGREQKPAGEPSSTARDVTTYRYDLAQSGVNAEETVLTPANVSASTFGSLFSHPLDGQAYAQPLLLSNVLVGGAYHDVVFVATQHGSVYAFDATARGAGPLWQVSLLDTAHGAQPGATPVLAEDVGSDDIQPEIAITSTPVIDPASGTLFVVAKSKEDGVHRLRLHALVAASGEERRGSPVLLEATVPGWGTGTVDGVLSFDARWANQRPALTLAGGRVLVTSASHGDLGPYHGWLLAYDAATLALVGVWNATPEGAKGGIWMSGAGVAVDADGHGYLTTGDGTFDEALERPRNLGNAAVRLDLGALDLQGSPGALVDWFAPHDEQQRLDEDADFGSSGIVLLPDLPGRPRLALAGDKRGHLLVLDRDALGRFDPVADRVLQSIDLSGGVFSTPTYFAGRVYVDAARDALKAYALLDEPGGLLAVQPAARTEIATGWPGTSPIVSANGTAGGIVWSLQSSGAARLEPGVLRAYDAADLSLLWSSDGDPRDGVGPAVKFTVPVVANGRVYVASGDRLTVYGLRP